MQWNQRFVFYKAGFIIECFSSSRKQVEQKNTVNIAEGWYSNDNMQVSS